METLCDLLKDGFEATMSKCGATSAIAVGIGGLPDTSRGLDIERDSFWDGSRIGILEEREEIGSGSGVVGIDSNVDGMTRVGVGTTSVTRSEEGKESKGS